MQPVEGKVEALQATIMGSLEGINTLLTNNMDTYIQTKWGEIENRIAEKLGNNAGFRDSNTFQRPIMEYKVIESLKQLTDDKTGYRDWRIKLKDGLAQVFKREDFLEVMTWLEDPNTTLDGQESLWDLANLSNIKLDEEVWETIAKALQSILLHKSEEKSQAFVFTKRAKTGFGTWREVNK